MPYHSEMLLHSHKEPYETVCCQCFYASKPKQ